MRFHVNSQSGSNQPNSIPGLLLWIDASEAGTLSRCGTTATKVYDKSPGGYTMSVHVAESKPKILQSRFKGRTVLRFEKLPQLFVGAPKFDECINLTTIGIVNGKLFIDCADKLDYLTVDGDLISIPALNYKGPIEVAELMVYDTLDLSKDCIDILCEYLQNKWDI